MNFCIAHYEKYSRNRAIRNAMFATFRMTMRVSREKLSGNPHNAPAPTRKKRRGCYFTPALGKSHRTNITCNFDNLTSFCPLRRENVNKRWPPLIWRGIMPITIFYKNIWCGSEKRLYHSTGKRIRCLNIIF